MNPTQANPSTLGEPIARGRTAEVFAWGNDRVLKLYYSWCPPDWVRHEEEIGRTITAMNLPAPKLIDTLQVDGRHGILYERIRGISMLQLCNKRPWLVLPYARQFAELHTRIHQQNGDGLPSLPSSLADTIQRVDILPQDLKTGVLELLSRLHVGKALCHFDFHPDQVLITPTGAKIIDWMTALQGNPLADVARSTLILRFAQVPYGGRALRAMIQVWRGLFLRLYLARYIELNSGASFNQIQTWMVPVAAARLKEGIWEEQDSLLRLVQASMGKR